MAQAPEILGCSERIIRFGPFEADLSAGELRKQGRLIRIQEQPFQVLTALLERPGELVTREQIRERLWPGQTFVDFDQGLNTAVNKLREALQDSAGAPQYIETLPKRGYRLVCPVEGAPIGPVAREPKAPKTQSARRWVVVAAVAPALALAFWLGRATGLIEPAGVPFRRFAIEPPAPLGLEALHQKRLAVSPDGKQVLGAIADRVWILDFAIGQWIPVNGSSGALVAFWSPDSRNIAFATRTELRRVAVEGGAPTTICKLPDQTFFGGSWSPDGQSILFSSRTPARLYLVSAAGGAPEEALSLAEIQEQAALGGVDNLTPAACLYDPSFLPLSSGRGSLFAIGAADSFVAVHDFEKRETSILGRGYAPVYSPTRHILYLALPVDPSAGTADLWALPFALDRLQPTAPPFLVASGADSPTVAADGTLAYLDASAVQLALVDRAGAKLDSVGPLASAYFYPALSPDGRAVAVESPQSGNLDLWTLDLARGARLRMSNSPVTEILPVWSRSGDELAYGSYQRGELKMFVRSSDGALEEREIRSGMQGPERIGDWSGDGQIVVYSAFHPDTGWDLWYLIRRGPEVWEPHPFLVTSANESSPKLSSNGRYIAYLSDETGRYEAYIQPFPGAGRKWPVSSGGAAQIRWRRDGRELFYAEAGVLTAIPVQLTPAFRLGLPQRLFASNAFELWLDPNYDISADGTRILLPEDAAPDRMVRIVQNWIAGFPTTRH